MKVSGLLQIPVGHSCRIKSEPITRELVAKYAELCGFAFSPHVLARRSIFSAYLGIEDVAVLHGVGTLCLLNKALGQVFQFSEPYDVVSFKYSEVPFSAPNIEGGMVEIIFTVLAVEKSTFPIRKENRKLPMPKITFECEIVNSRTQELMGSSLTKFKWTVGFISMNDLGGKP